MSIMFHANQSARVSPIRTILAAVDGSPNGLRVVTAAKELAAFFDARLHLFRAVWVPQELPAAAHSAQSGLTKVLTRQASEDLERLAGGDPRVVLEPPLVDFGKPWRAILEASRRLGVDLIVVGSHGFGRSDHLLGATAAGVVNRADRQVWVVHGGGTGDGRPYEVPRSPGGTPRKKGRRGMASHAAR
jgi:nucleotide-binding universal stress UspA family protein